MRDTSRYSQHKPWVSQVLWAPDPSWEALSDSEVERPGEKDAGPASPERAVCLPKKPRKSFPEAMFSAPAARWCSWELLKVPVVHAAPRQIISESLGLGPGIIIFPLVPQEIAVCSQVETVTHEVQKNAAHSRPSTLGLRSPLLGLFLLFPDFHFCAPINLSSRQSSATPELYRTAQRFDVAASLPTSPRGNTQRTMSFIKLN